MSDKSELFQWLDAEILSGVSAINYAQEHIEEIISSAYEKCIRKVYTSNGYDLGIVCPSLVNHRVIGGHKRGRVLKSIPENANYCEIGFDAEDAPLYFKMINTFGTETTYYFFHFDGFIWAMNMSLPARVWHDKIKKFRYDALGRIAYYAEMTSPYSGETPDFGCSITNVKQPLSNPKHKQNQIRFRNIIINNSGTLKAENAVVSCYSTIYPIQYGTYCFFRLPIRHCIRRSAD